jgi:hypothetical protein
MRLKEVEGFNTLEEIAHYATQIPTQKVDIANACRLKIENTKFS